MILNHSQHCPEPYPESSVRPECRSSTSPHWTRGTYLASFASVTLAPCPETCRLQTQKLACFVFSSLSCKAPPYLTNDIHLVSEGPRRRLRSSTDRSCAVPRTHNTFGDRSFAVAGPRVWNSLPAHLRDEDITYNSFRRELKKTYWV